MFFRIQNFGLSGRALLFVAALAFSEFATATSVRVITLTYDRIEVAINGEAPRTLWVGETSIEGVKLRSIDNDAAVLEVDAKLWRLAPGQSTFAQTTLQADARGQFFVTARINDMPAKALIDTGATAVALNSEEASRMGIDYLRGRRVTVQTANGAASAYVVTLASVEVGDILLTNVPGTVIEGGGAALSVVLIGMSFLRQVDMQRSGNTMVLQRRH